MKIIDLTQLRNALTIAALAIIISACSNNNDDDGVEPDLEPPTVEALNDLSIDADTPSGNISISAMDDVTPSGELTIDVRSSNQAVVADARLSLNQNVLVITPVSDTVGSTVITVSVTDASGNVATQNFHLEVAVRELSAVSFVESIAQIDEDAEPVFINQVIVLDGVDEELGFDALLD